MKIAHVTATFPPYYSGTGMVCYHNARGLAAQGHEVTVFTADYPPGAQFAPPGVRVCRLPVTFRLGNAPFLPGLLRLDGFDIIHLHHPFIFGAELICAAAARAHIPYILTHHNDLIGVGARRYLFNAYTHTTSRMVLGRADRLGMVSLDYAAASPLSPLLTRHRDKVVEIPNGVDAAHFHPSADGASVRAQLGIPAGVPAILFVAALDQAHHFKGLSTLLHAVARLSNERTALVVIGDGELKAHYAKEAQQLGIDARTHFVGKIANQQLPPYYAAADLVVLPSSPPESFGMVLIEGMACGKPVIASNIPGVRSVVSDGEDGLLIQPGDAEDLARKIHILLQDATLRDAMGRRGRAKVERVYDWARVNARLAEIYQDVVGS